MSYKIILQPSFMVNAKVLAKKYKSFKQDLSNLKDELQRNEFAGTDLGEGLRKVRMAIASKNKGKSHGARVITFNYYINHEKKEIHLLFIYDKKDMENIPKKELARLLENFKKVYPDYFPKKGIDD